MAYVSGDILPLNRLDPMMHAVGAVVSIRHDKKLIASGEVTDDDTFRIEIPDDLRGEIEISLGLHNAAPSLAQAEGDDIHVTVLYSNVNNFIA